MQPWNVFFGVLLLLSEVKAGGAPLDRARVWRPTRMTSLSGMICSNTSFHIKSSEKPEKYEKKMALIKIAQKALKKQSLSDLFFSARYSSSWRSKTKTWKLVNIRLLNNQENLRSQRKRHKNPTAVTKPRAVKL